MIGTSWAQLWSSSSQSPGFDPNCRVTPDTLPILTGEQMGSLRSQLQFLWGRRKFFILLFHWQQNLCHFLLWWAVGGFCVWRKDWQEWNEPCGWALGVCGAQTLPEQVCPDFPSLLVPQLSSSGSQLGLGLWFCPVITCLLLIMAFGVDTPQPLCLSLTPGVFQ